MAGGYNVPIEFTAKDGQIKKAIKNLGVGLTDVKKKTDNINKSFAAISKSLKIVGTEFVKLSKSIDSINKGSKKSPLNQKALTKGVTTLKQITKLNKEIAKEGSLLSGRGVKNVEWQNQLKTLQETVKTLSKAGAVFSSSEAGLGRQIQALQQVSRETDVAVSKSSLYARSIRASAKAEQELAFKQLERIKVQSRFYSGKIRNPADSGYQNALRLADMAGTIGQEKGIAKNIASLNVYKAELQKALSLVELQGAEYKELEKAIQKVNNILDEGSAVRRKINDEQKIANDEERKAIKEIQEGAKNIVAIFKEQEKVAKRVAKDQQRMGNFLMKLAKLGGKTLIGKGPGGWLGQTAALVGLTDLVNVLATAVNSLIPAWGKTEKIASSHLHQMIRGVAEVKGTAIGLQKVLGAVDWVSSAIKGFMEFENAAAEIIWSVERNYRSAFSSMGKMVRELPMLASAAMMVMPEWMGGRGMKGDMKDWLPEGGPVEMRNALDEVLGERIARRRPSRLQALEGRLTTKQRSLAATDPDDKQYKRRRQEVFAIEKLITKEKKLQLEVENKLVGKVSTEEQAAAKEALENQKKKFGYSEDELDITKRKNLLLNKSNSQYKRTVMYGGKMLTIEQRLEAVQKRKQARQLANQRLPENLMLGAGFPMLFGGGVGSVGGGLLGAGLQYATASQGFGAQIFFSAIGQQLDTFTGKIADLGKAFNVLNPDVDAVISSLGETNTAYGKHLEMLKAIKGEGAAMEAAKKAVESIIGKEGLGKIESFGQDVTDFGNEWAKVALRMQSSIADLITRTGILKSLTNAMAKGTSFERANAAYLMGTASPEVKSLFDEYMRTNQTAKGGLTQLFNPAALVDPSDPTNPKKVRSGKRLRELIIQAYDANPFQANTDLLRPGSDAIHKFTSETGFIKQKMNVGERQATIDKRVADAIKANPALEDRRTDLIRSVTANFDAQETFKKHQDDKKAAEQHKDKLADLDKEIAGQKELMNMDNGSYEMREREAEISKAILGLNVEQTDAVKGRLEYLYDLQDVNENIRQQEEQLQAVYDAIGVSIRDGLVEGINAAIDGTKTLGEVASNTFRRISNALLNYAVNIGLSSLPGVGPMFAAALGTNVGRTQTVGSQVGSDLAGHLGKAKGGPVTGGSPYIVGEKGPELFVPGSSGNIVPNHAMGGATNVVVNVDASGSSAQGDSGQAEQLGDMIGQAVQMEIVNQSRPGGLLARR